MRRLDIRRPANAPRHPGRRSQPAGMDAHRRGQDDAGIPHLPRGIRAGGRRDGAGGAQPTAATEAAGRDRPPLYSAQRSSAELIFVARDVPGCGHRTFYMEAPPMPAGLAGISDAAPVADDVTLETHMYRLDTGGGRVVSLVERHGGHGMVGSGVAGPAGTGTHRFGEVVVLEDVLLDLGDGPAEQAQKVPVKPVERPGPPNFTGRAWTSGANPARVRLVERGPLRTRVVLAGEEDGCSTEQEITLYEHIERAEVTLRLDWQGHKNTLVRAAYPLAVPQAVTTYETPYGSVVHGHDELPNTYRGEGSRMVQKWIDLSAGDGSGIDPAWWTP
jgi:hypothetical protein